MSANYYLADELANKVIHLSKALNKAQDTISVLEAQNRSLKDILSKTVSTDNAYENIYEASLSSKIE